MDLFPIFMYITFIRCIVYKYAYMKERNIYMGFFDFLKNKPKEEEKKTAFESGIETSEKSIGDMMHELDDLIADIDKQIAERDANKEQINKE